MSVLYISWHLCEILKVPYDFHEQFIPSYLKLLEQLWFVLLLLTFMNESSQNRNVHNMLMKVRCINKIFL